MIRIIRYTRKKIKRSFRRVSSGRSTHMDIRKKLGFGTAWEYCGLTQSMFDRLLFSLKEYPQFSDKKKKRYFYIRRLHRAAGYRSERLRRGLPVRGQRTHTNAKTRKRRRIL